MVDLTRRIALMAGGAAVGATLVGLRIAAGAPGTRPDVRALKPTRSATAVPEPRTTLPPLPDPIPFITFSRLSTPGVMQDFSYLPGTSTWFVTQRTTGSAPPYETVIVNRVDSSGTVQDAMTLLDGGHGLGIEADAQADGTYIWLTWQGKSPDSGWRENDFVRLRYTPGVWTRGQAAQQLALEILPVKDEPEAQYRFDWKNDSAVERHYDWNGRTETYKRRRISDIRAGVLLPDDRIPVLPLPVNLPTTQGFATIDDTFYRWLGTSTVDDAIDPADPIALQRFSWTTGELLSEQRFATLSRTGAGWPGGKLEPEGMCMFREPDGTATLLVGDTTGTPEHEYHVSAFGSIVPA